MIHLLDINQDCVEHIMRFLDIESLSNISETCTHLKKIAEQAFKKHKYYECEIANEDNIKKASKIIRKVGPHITKLHLTFYMVDATLYAENGIGVDFLLLVNVSLSEQFRQLTLSGQIWSIPVVRLAPTLLKLEKLHIRGETDSPLVTMSMDLPQLCPNLQTLIVDECSLIFAPNQNKSFPNLQVLRLLSFGSYYPIDSFVLFIEENKQLKRLHIDQSTRDVTNFAYEYINLRVLGNSLKFLEELRVQTMLFDDLVQGITDLKQLNQMTVLALTYYWDDIEQINDALHILKSMKLLKKLWFGSSLIAVPNQQAVINIAVELKQLELFESNLKCELETITEFIRHGRNLQSFHLQLRRRRVLTPIFVENLATLRESVARKHSPLSLYFYTNIRRDVKQVLEKPNIQRFLTYEYSPNTSYLGYD